MQDTPVYLWQYVTTQITSLKCFHYLYSWIKIKINTFEQHISPRDLREYDHLENLGVDGRVRLKWI